jgi:hypothetical protein
VSFWVLVQILANLTLFALVGVLWVKLNRPAKDDPRLSKGLQLLQSKISVLEDLSDRTETQVSQLTALLETKCREIQEKIVSADRQIAKIEMSAQKSLEVAKIFQDRIPHSEILERQNTIKYVKAARLAHQGLSVDEIAQQVDLSRAEIDFIAKVNRDQLQFSEEDLPAWAIAGDTEASHALPGEAAMSGVSNQAGSGLNFSMPRENFESAFSAPEPMTSALPKIDREFRAAVQQVKAEQEAAAAAHSQFAQTPSILSSAAASLGQAFMEIDLRAMTGIGGSANEADTALSSENSAAVNSRAIPNAAPAAAKGKAASQKLSEKTTITAQNSKGKTVEVRPVSFPRINVNDNLS